MKYLLPLLSLSLAACTVEDGDEALDTASDTSSEVEATVSLRSDVMPVFTASCGVCHNSGEDGNEAATRGGAFYESPENLLGYVGTSIVAGDADASPLVAVLAQELAVGGGPTLMPPPGTGIPVVAPVSLETIKTWINEGAQDN